MIGVGTSMTSQVGPSPNGGDPSSWCIALDVWARPTRAAWTLEGGRRTRNLRSHPRPSQCVPLDRVEAACGADALAKGGLAFPPPSTAVAVWLRPVDALRKKLFQS